MVEFRLNRKSNANELALAMNKADGMARCDHHTKGLSPPS